MNHFTESSTVREVICDPAFSGFGRLFFPVDRPISPDMTLRELSSSDVYLWYSEIRPETTVDILNTLWERASGGEQIFYPLSRADTGLFFLRGNPGEKFAVCNAGGGFCYVGAMHDSFPHALALSRMGYNAFALIYRPRTAYFDLADAIRFLESHAEELHVNPEGYSLWGGSAGARMAAELGNAETLSRLSGRKPLPRAAAVILQYTGYDACDPADAPTYACVGTNDGIASWRGMQQRLQNLEQMGIPTEFHVYPGLRHGFGLGIGTAAVGWIKDAAAFWEKQV